jgi:hypothetical protein
MNGMVGLISPWRIHVETFRRSEPAAHRVREEITTPSVQLGARHPLAGLSGALNDVPWWDDFVAAKQEYRRRVDANDSAE